MARNLNIDLILLEVAEGLKRLIENPDISQKIKDAYALTDEEQKKLADSQATMDNADALLAEIAKREKALDDINARIAEAEKLEAFNEDTLKQIATQRNEITQLSADNDKKLNDLAVAMKDMEEERASLDDYKALLSAENKRLIEYEARLNKAAIISQEALKAI